MNSMTPFQIGAKKGHRAQEHIFLMKSMMQMFLMMKKPLIIQLYDVSKFFDKENLADVMTTVHEAGVKDKLYRLLTKLNEKRIIKVLTPVGETDEVEIGEGLSQGTLESATLSSSSLGVGVNDKFASSPWESSYGMVRLQPILFQDDIGRLVSSLQTHMLEMFTYPALWKKNSGL